MRLAGSFWLFFLQAAGTRRANRLLQLIGSDPWRYGWDILWGASVIYWGVRSRVQRSKYGSLVYVGETVCMLRRACEHITRIMSPAGKTQQPFYVVVRQGSECPLMSRVFLCEWLFVPVKLASIENCARKHAEREMIRLVGSLNPPKCYCLKVLRSVRVVRGKRLFSCRRRVRRLRKISNPVSLCPVPVTKHPDPVCESRSSIVHIFCSRKSKNDGLHVIATALAGHVFPGSEAALKSAWGLAPAMWAYVHRRIDRELEGWRRRRGLHMLRIISAVRKDLVPPICEIQCSIVWPGTSMARDIILKSVQLLISKWRQQLYFVPVVHDARFKCCWAASPTLKSCLATKTNILHNMLLEITEPVCNCAELIACNPSWPCIVVEGQRHIAAPQSFIPWPVSLKHFARLPASITLPPKKSQLISSLGDVFRRLQARCHIKDDFGCVESCVTEIVAQIWPLVEARASKHPISWGDVSRAKEFLGGLFVSMFDHNTSHIGVFCMKLVSEHARAALDLDKDCFRGVNFDWSSPLGFKSVLARMSYVRGLPHYLQPRALSLVPIRSWNIGSPKFLPKWKAPGVKWRLLIDKHFTPCGGLHSITCRAIDVALNAMPIENSSDLPSTRAFIKECCDFNHAVRRHFPSPNFCIEAADMKDCFHHLPAQDCPMIWRKIQDFWAQRGVMFLSVPKKSRHGAGRLGKCELSGWVTLTFDDVFAVLDHFRETNFVSVANGLGKEVSGAPQGDALSGAVLRVFKWDREQLVAESERSHVIRFPGTHHQMISLFGCTALVLDVSFRDDVRKFCAWDSSSSLCAEQVRCWSRKNLHQRFQVGTMILEDSDPRIFIGLHTVWEHGMLQVWPHLDDPWGSAAYHDHDSSPLKPWESWIPLAQKRAVVCSLLCRCFYFSTSVKGLRLALWETFVCLIRQAGFPLPFVLGLARKWAKTWTPRLFDSSKPHLKMDPEDVEVAAMSL